MKSDTSPSHLFAAAQQAHRAGRLQEAAQRYRALLARVPDHADALHLLGLIVSQQGNQAEAARCIEQALVLAPQRPDFHNNLGEVLRRQGALDQAVASYRQALHLAPDFAEAHYNLANVRKQQGQTSESVRHYEYAVRLNPKHIQAYYNLGNTLFEQGDYPAAIAAYQQAIALHPSIAEVHLNLGNALNELYHIDQALKHYHHAIELKPDLVDAYRNVGQVLLRQGKTDDAQQMYQHVLKFEPDNDIFRLHVETLWSPVPFSNQQIDEYRTNLMATLERYAARPPRIDLRHLHTANGRPPYVLMYQGRDDRPLKTQWAALFGQHPVWREVAPASRPRSATKPHIGFVIARYHEEMFLQYMCGIINQFPTDRFQLTIVCSVQGGEAALRPAITNPAVSYLPLSPRFDQAVEQVRQAEFDLLHYWEVGSDINNYFLPFCRLAPVQCATWGNPVTTGIPAIDYFISSELLETDTSDDHYSETLVRLPHLPTYYARPPIPSIRASRDDFGFSEGQHLYLCAQNVRKIHPDFDRLAYELLQRDPRGVLVFLEGKHEHVTALFRQRLAQRVPDVFEQIRFLPRLSTQDYWHLVALADVFLEPPHYNAAPMNYDALAAGTPMITLPTAFMRGRSTFALYQQIGVTDCIATSEEEYVALALRFGSDRAERADISARIASNSPALFEDVNAVHELADFFDYALETARSQ